MKESGIPGYLFFQFKILNAPICSSANGLYVIYMYCQNTCLQIFLHELQVHNREVYISSFGDDVLFDQNQCIYILNKILLKLSLGDSND